MALRVLSLTSLKPGLNPCHYGAQACYCVKGLSFIPHDAQVPQWYSSQGHAIHHGALTDPHWGLLALASEGNSQPEFKCGLLSKDQGLGVD